MVRGHRSGLLTTADYNNLCQCETLDDIKLNLVRLRSALSENLCTCFALEESDASTTVREARFAEQLCERQDLGRGSPENLISICL